MINVKYKTIDLCAGIGGLRRGFEMTGAYENVLSAEIDKYACLAYKHLYGDNPENDIATEEFKKKADRTEYDVLLAGFPCQPFSQAGLKKGFDDREKGTLFLDIAEIISRTRPRGIFLENVSNLIYHDRGRTFQEILYILENELNYNVLGVRRNSSGDLSYKKDCFIRNSMDFGIPQDRKRVYIMAFDRERYADSRFCRLKQTLPERSETPLYNDLNSLLNYGADPHYYLSEGFLETLESHRKREEKKGNGFGYRIVNLPQIKHPYANTILATGGSGKERNLVYDPQSEISGMTVPGKATPINSRGIRCMTPEEWGKLQGFINYAFLDESGNDTFSFPEEIPETQKYKLFGNAVSIPVIKCMAEYMYDCLNFLDSACDGKSLSGLKGSCGHQLQESIRDSHFEVLFYAEDDGKRTQLINIKRDKKGETDKMTKKSLEEKIAEAEVLMEKRRRLYEESKKEVAELKNKKAAEDNAKILKAMKKTNRSIDEILAFLGEESENLEDLSDDSSTAREMPS